MLGLIIIGYYKKDSFCHRGIVQTIHDELIKREKKAIIVDLYQDGFDPSYQEKNKKLIEQYQEHIKQATHIYFVSPVWWFRCTAMLEGFFDQVFTPGFAYNFVKISKHYGMPKPLLSDKTVYAYITHGAPSLPVLTIYLNTVKYRLSLGVFSFIFGWFGPKIRQFWSVPFCSEKKREKYVESVKKDVETEVRKWNQHEERKNREHWFGLNHSL